MIRNLFWYSLGLFTVTLFVLAADTLVDKSHYNTVKKAITECEKNLPRTQTCVITAVPKEGRK